ncbi:MAG: substrate-binding domain-containing protein [Chloroflexi bacterium]|nr:substrate-binding domain-containing protein [Chloroflexota bacterium]MCY3607299.1 substrate-binding domain-containing protein [Acidimicrobiaceae bacterium]MCY3587780.1 substrate-binding domain-containing protein [Chloroflexota bacterium]MDE2709012.1 substrate-binding domain-containing protein [Chloroflexota bacterium]MXX81795.1 substrate-binding domain-containing protein [Chloroflexota bacterium]
MITHGTPYDFFWYQVLSALAGSQGRYNISLRPVMEAAAIDQCVADGTAAIATTLADADALASAIGRATDAGVRMVTFNSGSDCAPDVGAVAHVASDETAVGRIAFEQFLARDVSGEVLGIIHEPTNRGFKECCDALGASYDGGEVRRPRISESDQDAVTKIAGAVTDNLGGARALNANTADDMAAASANDQPSEVLAAVFADFPRPLAMLAAERLSLMLWSHALDQGYQAGRRCSSRTVAPSRPRPICSAALRRSTFSRR